MDPNLLRPLRYVRSYPLLLLGAIVAMIISVAATVGVPQIMKSIITDIASTTAQRQFALSGALAILGLGVVRSVTSLTQGLLLGRVAEGVGQQLRRDLFAKLEQLGFSYHDHADSGQLITRFTSDVENVKGLASTAGVVLQAILVIIATAVILFLTNWTLTLFTLIVLPPIALLMWRFQKVTPPLFIQAQQRSGMIVSVLQENITNMRIVRVFGREEYQMERFREAVQAAYVAMLKIMRNMATYIPILQLFALAASAIVIGVGGYYVIGGTLTLPELVAFSGYVSILVGPIFSLVGVIFNLSRSSASAKRLYEVLDQPLDIADPANAPALPPAKGRVVFDNVTFRYPGAAHDALQEISFTAEPGQLVAVVGQTGSGKTTLVNLIPRFYEPTAGQVTIDGHNVHDVSLDSLRSQIAIAMQIPQLFKGTVRENIAFGRPDATLEEIEAAAQLAQAHKFIEALPLGYDTELGEAGAGLSGGQKQRLTLARAFLLRSPILILDDSLSALDAQTKREVLTAIQTLPWPCTRFLLGEQAGAADSADLILVLEGGRLVAQLPILIC